MTVYRFGLYLFATVALATGLLVNGAIPGWMAPTTGQAIWTLSFAQSFANGGSIYAINFGLPAPAAISFGLSAAFPMAVLLKFGMPSTDTYALIFAIWLSVAYFGAFSFVRLLGGRPGISLLLALVWITFPVIWAHSGYSMLSLGLALLPTYFYSVLRFLRCRSVWSAAFFAGCCIISVFMDGYSFMFFAVGSIGIGAVKFIVEPEERRRIAQIWVPIFVLGFGTAYVLYAMYIGRAAFPKDSLDFFRAYGADIEFFLVPTRGILLLSDILGLSEARSATSYFADPSVFMTSFSLGIVVAAIYALASRGAQRTKVIFGLIAIVGFYMALGPSFKWYVLRPADVHTNMMASNYAPWPTGTGLLSRYVPGFDNMRASYRWVGLGIFGAWAILAAHVGNRRTQTGVTIAVVLALLSLNMPSISNIRQYIDNRQMIEGINKFAKNIDKYFVNDEMVAFAPFNNDFLVNFISSKDTIRTYNIGGDKNLSIAMRTWPRTMRAFQFGAPGPNFVSNVATILKDGDVDVVAIPYMNMLWAAHRWPYPLDLYDTMRPYVEKLTASGLFTVKDTKYFAFVRLAYGKDTGHRAAGWKATETCVNSTAKQRPALVQGAPLPFSKPDSVCESGWSHPESWGRWTDGKAAELHFTLPELNGAYELEFSTRGYIAGSLKEQRIGIRVNGKALPDWVYTPSSAIQLQRVEVPQGARSVDIEFSIPDALSPKQAGQSADGRSLGLGISAVCLAADKTVCLSK
jgi:hypothetical protein